MKNYKGILILLNLVLILGYFSYSVMQKENLSKDGKLVLLELAPVDPRSLMQGDYMNLRYQIASEAPNEYSGKQGYCVVKLGSDGVAHFVRLQKEDSPINANELLIKFKSSGWEISLGAESFFFQEGHAERYEEAKYGALRVDEQGNSILVGLYNNQRKKIE